VSLLSSVFLVSTCICFDLFRIVPYVYLGFPLNYYSNSDMLRCCNQHWHAAAVLVSRTLFVLCVVRLFSFFFFHKDTEIDWIAYMEEVAGYLGGEYDYTKLGGGTGPLVYPAGFVYIYSGFYYLTNFGENIRLAQYIFLGIYLLSLAVTLKIYQKAKVPLWAVVLLCASRRLHSIFMLRLFNDCIAMLFLFVAVLMMLNNRWSWACVWYSLAVSVKMNVLLFAPGMFFLMVQRFGVLETFKKLISICATIQVVLGLPFLLTYPWSYIGRAFEFGRQFKFIWTVNFKFLPEDLFLSKELALSLLTGQLLMIFLFAQFQWCRYVQSF
jgi:alpha-1,3-mannosyltransferase